MTSFITTPIIPPMVHELGRYWDQPDPALIHLTLASAYMTQETFGRLKDYSNSRPTGAYAGKMWKRRDMGRGRWYLCWFSDPEPGYDYSWGTCNINMLRIYIEP